jgi:acetyl esterase/lipase
MKRVLVVLFVVLVVGVPSMAQRETDQEGSRRSAEAVKAQWLEMDTNGDGKITKDEAEGQLKTCFDRNDADADGFIDQSELDALSKRLFSRNSTGRQRTNPNQNTKTLSTPDLLKQAPAGVTVIPDIAYREGEDSWKLDLAMPTEPGDEPRPAIVFVHGGGWVNGDKRAAGFINPTLEFASKGYVCISVNYRLGVTKTACIEDVKCSVRWLRAHAEKYNVDPDRIGAYGNSAGAHLVTMLGICPKSARMEGDGPWKEHSSMVQAVVASATPTSPRVRAEWPEDAKKIQPMTYVSADVPPFLLVHEESDKTVAVSNSDDFVKALQELGAKDITYMRLEDGTGHGVFMQNIEKTGPAREKFFDRTLKKNK